MKVLVPEFSATVMEVGVTTMSAVSSSAIVTATVWSATLSKSLSLETSLIVRVMVGVSLTRSRSLGAVMVTDCGVFQLALVKVS